MENAGLNYLLRFSKIQKNEKIGDIEAIDFKINCFDITYSFVFLYFAELQ